MRLRHESEPARSGRSRLALRVAAALALAAWVVVAVSGQRPLHAQDEKGAPDPLGNLEVPPGATRPLPKIAVVPSLSADFGDVVLRSVIVRDLDLSGEVEILPDSAAPLVEPDVDIEAWKKKGVEAVVSVSATTKADVVTMRGRVFLVKTGTTPVFDHEAKATSAELRVQSHRMADRILGALTGQDGSFASRMTFVAGTGPLRFAFVVDSDGHDPRSISRAEELVIDSTFGKDAKVHRVSSVQEKPYRIRIESGVVPSSVEGPVYGLAFSKDGSRVAVSIARSDGIRVFEGPDLSNLGPPSVIATALEPTFTPSGKVAFSGAGKFGQRVYVDGKPVSPDGVFASSPTFCNNPDGVLLLFAAGAGKRTDLVRSGEGGGGLYRLTNDGSSAAPACSPDGRLVAFFSKRTTGEGPGLYVMRVDGRRPRRVSTLLGDTLDWARLPP